MTDTSAVYNRLLAQGYGLKLFGPGKREGKETVTGCSFCGGKRFSYSQEKPVWKCWNCGKGGDWIDYLVEAKGMDFPGALRLLADEAGLRLDGVDRERYKAEKVRRDILEAAQAFFQEALFQKKGDKALRYLLDRGYSIEDVKEMGLGAYVDSEGVKKALLKQGFSEAQIEETGLLMKGFGETHIVSILWPDAGGRPLGLVCRTADGKTEPKYLYSKGMKRSYGLLGFEKARGSKAVFLVEGVLDALYLNAKGLTIPAVAAGGTSLSEEQIQVLKDAGTEELLLGMDMDEAGRGAVDKAIQPLTKKLFRVYVVSLPLGYKDPDELARKEGLSSIEKALREAQSWPEWKAFYLVSLHDLTTPRGRDGAIRGFSSAWGETRDLMDREAMKKAFIRAYTDATGEDVEALNQRLKLLESEASKEDQKARLSLLSNTINQKLQADDLPGARRELEDGLAWLQGSLEAEAPDPYLLEDFERDILAAAEGLATGYPSLDKWAKIPAGALTIVAGRPGQGKTSFLLNILRNQLEADSSGLRFYFYSYEVARRYLALRLLMLMSERVLSRETNEGAFINYLRTKKGTEPKIEKALERFREWTASGRLVISDAPLRAEDLSATIGKLAERGDTGAVFVDYLQKVPSDGPRDAQRYLQVARSSQLLLEQAIRQDIPLVLGAQLNRQAGEVPKLEHLRESGDIEQDAHLVLGLQNKGVEEQETSGRRTLADKVELTVSILKNRNGVSGGSISLDFEQAILKIRDPNAGSPF